MQIDRSFSRAPVRALVAAAALAAALSAQASTGFTIAQRQEALVTVGMTTAEVMQALGRPAQNLQYGNEPGPTWTYDVSDALKVNGEVLFDVDFGADGRVAAISERVLEDIGGTD